MKTLINWHFNWGFPSTNALKWNDRKKWEY